MKTINTPWRLLAETTSVQPGFHQDEQPSEFTTVSAPTHYDNPAAVIGIGSAAHMDGGGGEGGVIGIGSGAHFDGQEEPVGIQSATH